MSKRRKLSRKDRAEMFQRCDDCLYCGGKITVGQRWEAAHIIDRKLLENNEEIDPDDLKNYQPAHYKCHREYTYNVGNPAIAKALRLEAKHNGYQPKRSRFQTSRDGPWKQKIGGQIVPR